MTGCFVDANVFIQARNLHDPVPRLADGGIDLGHVTAITIIEVIDYH